MAADECSGGVWVFSGERGDDETKLTATPCDLTAVVPLFRFVSSSRGHCTPSGLGQLVLAVLFLLLLLPPWLFIALHTFPAAFSYPVALPPQTLEKVMPNFSLSTRCALCC